MFTPDERSRIQTALIEQAHADDQVAAAALLGSSATGAQDEFSDIDLAICVDGDSSLAPVIERWTATMHERHGAVDTVDVHSGTTLYRVFLLAGTLQVDLSFWTPETFAAAGPGFRQLFGTPARDAPAGGRPAGALIGEAWLYLLHVRSSIGRGRVWQADYMLSHTRECVLELACRRHGLPGVEARGVDELPAQLLAAVASTRPAALTEPALRVALGATAMLLLDELAQLDPQRAQRVGATVAEIGGRRLVTDRDETQTFDDWQPAHRIREAPELYELASAALDPDGLVLRAIRDAADWSGRTLLDLGCATGFWLPGYAADAARVIGVDPDPELRRRARERTAALANVEVLAGSAEHIPLPDDSVDVVHARSAYFWGAGAEAGLQEVRRVLAPGGVLIVIDNDHHLGELAQVLDAAAEGVAGRDQTAIDAWWAGQGASRASVLSQWHFATRADLEAVLEHEFPGGAGRDWLERNPDQRHITYGFALFGIRA